ncbi:helix-turn-helix domain-containing protein [Rhodovulum kholense]|uniref:helix-turn-helix domain-containing protein n=1 Tax=Rhodovulum kholense TaxID=453584 RepID=UPI001304AA0C
MFSGFSSWGGDSFSRHIRQKRLGRSRADLLDMSQNGVGIAQIAHRWGFAGAAHFSLSFHDAFGISRPARCARTTGMRRFPTPFAAIRVRPPIRRRWARPGRRCGGPRAPRRSCLRLRPAMAARSISCCPRGPVPCIGVISAGRFRPPSMCPPARSSGSRR